MLVSNDCWKKLNKEKQVEWRTSTKLDHPGKWRPGEGLCWARTGLTVSMKSTSGCFRRRIGIFHDSAAWQNNGASKASYKILLLCCPCSESSTNCMPGRLSTVLVKEEKKGWPFSWATLWSHHSPYLILMLRLWVFFLSRLRMNHLVHSSLYWFSSNWIQISSYSYGKSTLYEATQSIPARIKY